MCTYEQDLERLLAHTYGQGSCTWLGRNGETTTSSRVHGEPTGWVETECVVVFIGRAWTEQQMETRPRVPQNGGNGLVFDRPRSKRDPVHREGTGVPQKEGNGLVLDLLRLKRGPVDRDGCGVPQNGGNGLVLERYGRNGGPIHREGCGVPQNGTPRDTVHLHRRPPPASTGSYSSSLHRALLHRLLFNHPSTIYCSSSPPHHGGPVHPPLHGHPSTVYYSSSPPPHHGVLFIQRQRHRSLFIHPPQRSLFIPSTGFS